MPNPKYVIECQKCPNSLTILYAVDNPAKETEEIVKKQLASLMRQHYNTHPGEPPSPTEMEGWVKKIRPV